MTSRTGIVGSPWKKLLSDAVEAIALGTRMGRVVQFTRFSGMKRNNGVYRLHEFAYQWLFRVFGRYTRILPQTHRHLHDKPYDSIAETDIWDIVMPEKVRRVPGASCDTQETLTVSGYRSIFFKIHSK